MGLDALLRNQRETILAQWLDGVYPLGTDGPFGHKTKAFFKGPMGQQLSSALSDLFDHLLVGAKAETVARSMDQVIRVLAVQEMLPSQAAGFLFPLKTVVRRLAKGMELEDELLVFDGLLDQLTRIGFDVYSKAREELHLIQIQEQKRQTEGVFKLANSKGRDL